MKHRWSQFRSKPDWLTILIAGGLILLWLLVLFRLPALLPAQLASWLAFVALLITPGYLLASMITWRLALDELERLALALPLGIAVLAVPGIMALLEHLTIRQLMIGWALATLAIVLAWLLHLLWFRRPAWESMERPIVRGWSREEVILLLLLAIAFVLIVPTLSLYKIDGDAYAVNSFAADALAGYPLNAVEPLFGTDLGPGVRMVFNQSLTMSYLWSYLAGVDPVTLIAVASRSMLALWALLAAYTLGQAAGGGRGGRRFGLLVAAIQMVVYLAAPFFRGDNVTIFFFERTNADKFMVPVTMLPVVFAMAIRYVRAAQADPGTKERGDQLGFWLAAAVATFAVSAIHPLIAAMLALGLSAFGGLHLLLHWRDRQAWWRGVALAGLVVLVMILPIMQLFMARGEAPLAPSYPQSFAGWSVGEKQIPVLPFVETQTLGVYGPLPELTQLEAAQAEEADNPFLIWRFAVNMTRRRLILLSRDWYISDPNLILEPVYLLAYLMLPVVWHKFRRGRFELGVQFVVATALAILIVMYNPLLTPLIGGLVMPWILWRFVWLLPYALILALVSHGILNRLTAPLESLADLLAAKLNRPSFALLPAPIFLLSLSLLLSPAIAANMRNINEREVSPYYFPAPPLILERLEQETAARGPAMVLAEQDLSVTIPAFVAGANIVAHRAPTTSEVFPADRQDEALQRLIDQDLFYRTPYLTSDSIAILQRYQVDYVITPSGGDIDLQLRLAPQWFEWLITDQSFSLYAVRVMPTVTPSVAGNTALAARQWEEAAAWYEQVRRAEPGDLLALVGLAEIDRARGQFDQAVGHLQEALGQVDQPLLHYQLGLLYAERGQVERSIAEFDLARQAAPNVARFHLALGDACLRAAREDCAAEQYELAVTYQALPDDVARLVAQADLWRQRSRTDKALPLYQAAVERRPSEFNHFVLASVYRELGQFDQAQRLVDDLQSAHPLSTEVMAEAAETAAAQGQYDRAIDLYRKSILLQNLKTQETGTTYLALAQVLLDANRLAEAEEAVGQALEQQPKSAVGHRLLGDLYDRQGLPELAVEAYRQAFALDPSQIAVYVSLSDQLRRYGGPAEEIPDLLQTAISLNPGEATLLIALGDQQQRLGEPQAAIEAYQAALDTLDPYTLSLVERQRPTGQRRAFIYARLASVYEDLGQLEPAMDYYRAVVSAAPEVSWTYVTLADAYRRRNELAEAERLYQRAISIEPTYLDGYVRLADLVENRRRTAEAEALYAQALEIAQGQLGANGGIASQTGRPIPTSSEDVQAASLTSGEDLVFTGERTAASELAPTARFDPIEENTGLVLVLSRLYQTQNQAGQAIALYRQGIDLGEADGWSPTVLARYYRGLGDLYLDQDQIEEGVAAYNRAVALDQWWPEARLGLAEALVERGDTASALAQLESAVEIAPGSVEVQVALANLLDRLGDDEAALAIYAAMAEAHPGNANATLALARDWQSHNQRDKARQAYFATLSMNPGTADAYIGLAELSMAQERFEEAELLLRRAMEADYQNINAYVRLVDLEQQRGNPDRVLAWFDQATTVSRDGQTIDLTLIDSLLRYGNYDTAQVYIREVLDRRPEDVELLQRLGAIQRTLGQYAAGEATLQAARRVEASNSQLQAELAELYLAQGQPQQALALYQEAINLDPGEEAFYLAMSRLLAAQGRADLALTTLAEGVGRVPRPVNLYATLSALELQQGQPERALATLEEGLNVLGENAQLLIALGTYHVSRANFDQAEESYRQALTLQPDSAAGHVALADLNIRRGELEAAIAEYKAAIALQPDNPGHHLALGNVSQLNGQLEEAAAAFSQALSLAPTMVEAYANLAVLYETEERWDDARAVYERGLAIAPASGQLLTSYGAFLLARGDDQMATTVLVEAGEKAPTAGTLIARAAVYSQQGQVDSAQQDLRTALELEPGSVDALIALGDLYRGQGAVDEARQAYEEAVALMPGRPIGYLRLGELAIDLGDLEEANRYVEAARVAEPGSLVRPEGQ